MPRPLKIRSIQELAAMANLIQHSLMGDVELKPKDKKVLVAKVGELIMLLQKQLIK